MGRQLLVFVACGAILAASGIGCGPVKVPSTGQQQAKKYTRDEFTKLVKGKTKDWVLATVGKPDHTSGSDSDNWFYKNLTTDPVSGKPDFQVMIVFRNGVAHSVVY